MTIENPGAIDFVAHDPTTNTVSLVMVEHRDWGSHGALLPELQAKLNTYLAYAVEGRFATDYPSQRGKPIRFDLRTVFPLGPHELEFLDLVRRKHLVPRGIELTWKQLGPNHEADSEA